LTVYIKEAHAVDEWQMDSNVEQNVCYRQPRSTEERVAIARDFQERFDYPLQLVVDPIENPANAIYAGWPERIYILDEERRIVYKGDPGPFGFHPEEAEEWLKERFGAGSAELDSAELDPVQTDPAAADPAAADPAAD
jgi:Iodothyronine deiodinase